MTSPAAAPATAASPATHPVGQPPLQLDQQIVAIVRDKTTEALKLETNKQVKRAEKIYEQLVADHPDYPEAWLFYGQFLYRHGTGRYDKARDTLKKGLDLNPKSPASWDYLALCYQKFHEWGAMETCLGNAIRLDPANLTYVRHLAFLLVKLGRSGEARPLLTRLLEEEPDAFAWFQQGMCHWLDGDIAAATTDFEAALGYDPNHALALRYSLDGCLYRHDHARLKSLINTMGTHPQLDPAYRKLMRMVNILYTYCEQPLDQAGYDAMAQLPLKGRDWQNFQELSAFDQFEVNMHAYWSMIRRLFENARANPDLPLAKAPLSNPDKGFYFIGESHSLSPTHLQFEVEGETLQAVPRLVIGVKVWHLIQERKHLLKTAFHEQLRHIPKGARIGISVGEVDCRPHEGIVAYFMRNPHVDGEAHVANMMKQFVATIKAITAERDPRQIYFIGVPAPVPKDWDCIKPKEKAQRDIIPWFNTYLEQEARAAGCEFLDFYSLTVDADTGFSNQQWHLDRAHLKPQAYVEIFKNKSAPV